MLFPAAWTNTLITRAMRQGTGESARDITHLRHRIRTQKMRDTSGVDEHVSDITRTLTAIIRNVGFDTTMEPLCTHRQRTKQAANPFLSHCCACRLHADGIPLWDHPSLLDLTCLVWPTLPQVFPRPQLGRLCCSIASSGRAVPAFLPTRHVLPPVAPQKPDLQS